MSLATLNDWIQQEAIPFDLNAPHRFDAAVDHLMARLGDSVDLLGIGEALHFGEAPLQLRNRLFQRLAAAHGFSAIAIESSFPRGWLVNEYVMGRGPATYDAVQEAGFGHGFGRLDSTRELVAWMRATNVEASSPVKLHFYGFDMPVLLGMYSGPRPVLEFVLDYLTALDEPGGQAWRAQIEPLLGEDAAWENPAATMDPSLSIGRSPEAASLRIATEDLIAELIARRLDLVAASDADHFAEALHHARTARWLLAYHATHAGEADASRLLSLRDAVMAENVAYILEREQGRGKVLLFAHNSHLQRGEAVWPWYRFWPVGAHLHARFGPRYAVIGTALGVSEGNGIGQPEAGSLEARLMALPESGAFIPTHRGQGLPADEIAALPERTGSQQNLSYLPLSARSFTDFDALALLDESAYGRGAPPPQQPAG